MLENVANVAPPEAVVVVVVPAAAAAIHVKVAAVPRVVALHPAHRALHAHLPAHPHPAANAKALPPLAIAVAPPPVVKKMF